MDTEALETPAAKPLKVPAGALSVVRWQEYQAIRTDWFRTPEAFSWFKRQHEAELIRAGALVVITGRLFVAVEAFDACVVAIGQRLAAGRVVEVA